MLLSYKAAAVGQQEEHTDGREMLVTTVEA